MTLREQLFKHIKESGLSEYRICKLAGISQGSFTHFKNQGIAINFATLEKICNVIGLDLTRRPGFEVPRADSFNKPGQHGRYREKYGGQD